MRFYDILYGAIEIPDWLIPFVKAPEFLRLRGVRLSNVDSFQFKDFNAPTRWEHSIGVAYLAIKYAEYKKLNEYDKVHLTIAALLHDIATPPFGHTMEYVISSYDHERESHSLLTYNHSENISVSQPIYAYQTPQIGKIVEQAAKKIGVKINIEEIVEIINGDNKLGYLLNSKIDLDNIDNVTRASLFLGGDIDRTLPLQLIKWLAEPENIASIEESNNPCVKKWLAYRQEMYKKFYYSNDEEIGRQAFLQHLVRRAIDSGVNSTSLIFNTDDSLLNFFENIREDSLQEYSVSIRDLVTSYRLLESPIKFIEIPIEDENLFDIINSPKFSNWLEKHITTKYFEPFVFLKKRRFYDDDTLFPSTIGTICIFKLHNANVKYSQLPTWLKDEINSDIKFNKDIPGKLLGDIISRKIKEWVSVKPWNIMNKRKKENILTNLEKIKNWNFKNSKNESLHIYPATFVHSIPATLINTLELKGELILDPFGGTGQTAMEALKQGCNAITSDSNSIANLICKTKFAYLPSKSILYIKNIEYVDIFKCQVDYKPKIENISKWHNDNTINELSKIHSFIYKQSDLDIKRFLTVCFSDIINSTTERKGKDFAYFADNTPLPSNISEPRYVDAISLFINKIQRNIDVVLKIYSTVERKGVRAKDEFKKISIYKNDILNSKPEDYGIKKGDISAIITSPPYLCMIDYTYGQRLSYYWLYPEHLTRDFNAEIGSRRTRTNSNVAKQKYLDDMRIFAQKAHVLLKKNGYLATVIGEPLAKNFSDFEVLSKVYAIFQEEGFELFWQSSRDIQWVRNYGVSKLKHESIAVHVKR